MTGFHQRGKVRPGGLLIVIALHGAALTALALIKGPEFVRRDTRTKIYDVPIPVPPAENVPAPPEPKPATDPLPRPSHESRLDAGRGPITSAGPFVSQDQRPLPPLPPLGPPGPSQPPAMPDPPIPVRVDARIDLAATRQLQPPYPASELRAEREGEVRMRLTIDAAGRVIATEKLSATSDAFWRAADRHARSHWRFRPATVDGQPVRGVIEMNLRFRLDDR